MMAVKLLLILLICFPAFSGVKAVRSATNPATSIDADGKINLVITSNTPRTKNYYNTTGFHLLAGIAKEVASTNYVLNSFFSIDSNSDGLADNFSKLYGTATREECSISNIPNAKSQKLVYTYTGEEASWGAIFSFTTPNDSINCSSANVPVTTSFDVKGDRSGWSTTTGIVFFTVNELDNSGTIQRSCYTSPITNVPIYITASWRRVSFQFTCTDTDTRKIACYFFSKTNIPGVPESGQTINFEIAHVQIEKSSIPTSFIPTTTTALTRNDETFSNPLIFMGD